MTVTQKFQIPISQAVVLRQKRKTLTIENELREGSLAFCVNISNAYQSRKVRMNL